MYSSSILWLLTWPVLIVATYFLVRLVLKILEKKKSS
jgi:hypothetical protein